MRKAVYVTTALAAAVLLLAGCGKKAAEGPAPDALKAEIAGVTGELNSYLDAHNFSNTDAGTLAAELEKLAGKYGELEKQAQEMKSQSGDEQYGDLGALAGEGRAKAEVLAGALAAGAPKGEADKEATLNDAVEEWVGYSDKVSASPGEPRYPGKGRHLGWWKNPEWARDRGTRPLPEGDVPGTGEMERKREREREREHVGPGGAGPGGAGGGKGPGGK